MNPQRSLVAAALFAAFALVALSPRVVDAAARAPRSPAELAKAIASAPTARVSHVRQTLVPWAAGTLEPCGRLEMTTVGQRDMGEKWIAELARALQLEQRWLPLGSLGTPDWLPVQDERDRLFISFTKDSTALALQVLVRERVILVMDSWRPRGAIEGSRSMGTILELTHEALPGDDWLLRPLSRDTVARPITTLGLPPISATSMCDIAPEPITRVPPRYPDRARDSRVSGTVTVGVLVSRAGDVVQTCVVGSAPMLDEAAVIAVEQWKFRPAMRRGSPVAAWTQVPVKFNLH